MSEKLCHNRVQFRKHFDVLSNIEDLMISMSIFKYSPAHSIQCTINKIPIRYKIMSWCSLTTEYYDSTQKSCTWLRQVCTCRARMIFNCADRMCLVQVPQVTLFLAKGDASAISRSWHTKIDQGWNRRNGHGKFSGVLPLSWVLNFVGDISVFGPS